MSSKPKETNPKNLGFVSFLYITFCQCEIRYFKCWNGPLTDYSGSTSKEESILVVLFGIADAINDHFKSNEIIFEKIY